MKEEKDRIVLRQLIFRNECTSLIVKHIFMYMYTGKCCVWFMTSYTIYTRQN